MRKDFDNFIRRMKAEDSGSFNMDAKGRAVHIIADAIQRMRNEGLGSIDIAKSLSHAAAVLAGREDKWEWEWEDDKGLDNDGIERRLGTALERVTLTPVKGANGEKIADVVIVLPR